MTISAVLICDDIRRDTSNKDIIIGVYSGHIIVPQMPIWLRLAVYLEYVPTRRGEQEFLLRLGLADAGLVTARMKVSPSEIEAVSVPITNLEMLVQQETDFLVEASLDGGATWQELKRKPIKVGALQSISPMPTVVGRPFGEVGISTPA